MSGVLKDVHALLAPLEQATARSAVGRHVHADKTGWRVFERVEGGDGTRWWLWVFVADDTVVLTMDPTRSATVLERHFGIDRSVGALPEAVAWSCPRTSSVCQSPARVEGRPAVVPGAPPPLLHPRRGRPRRPRYWCDGWVDRIALPYLARRDLAAAEPGSDTHRQAGQAFKAASTRKTAPPGTWPTAASTKTSCLTDASDTRTRVPDAVPWPGPYASEDLHLATREDFFMATDTGTVIGPLAPTAASVRHRGPLVLATDHRADLDAPPSDPQWPNGNDDVGYSAGPHENLFPNSAALYLGDKRASYETCRNTTGYSDKSLDTGSVAPGRYICVKTDRGRYSALRVTQLDSSKIAFDVITYDPPES